MSRTNAHSRRQVGSLVPVLRGIGRRAARGGVGWKVRTVGGSQTQSAALCSTEGGSRAYLTLLSRLEHLARSLCPKGLHLACRLCPKITIWHVGYAPRSAFGT